jgi:hypothetical protein
LCSEAYPRHLEELGLAVVAVAIVRAKAPVWVEMMAVGPPGMVDSLYHFAQVFLFPGPMAFGLVAELPRKHPEILRRQIEHRIKVL